jgi:hypothetical protein
MNLEDIFDPLDPQKLWDHLDGIVERDPFRHNCPNAGDDEIYSELFEFIECKCFPGSSVAKEKQEKLRRDYADFQEWERGGRA